ncbi:MAG: glucosaminidase domain-containing protein [Pseudomonadota bacterium]
MKDIVTDFGQFAALRSDAARGDSGSLEQVAEQFESLFLETMLSSMRKASHGDPIFGDSQAHSTYRQMFDQQLARDLAGKSGIGLAEILVRQLGGAGAAEATGAVQALAAKPGREVAPPGSDDGGTSPLAFVRRLWPYAARAAEALGTVPKAIIAQAALETGWGQRQIRHDDGGASHNFFGIKAGRDWSGEAVTRGTLEFVDGVARREQARFRAYPNAAAGFGDYARLLTTNPRYAATRDHGEDIAGFATALSNAGYATDPDYAQKIMAVADGDTMRTALAGLKFGGLTPME